MEEETERLVISVYKDENGGIISQMRIKCQDPTLAQFILAIEKKVEEIKGEYHKSSIDKEIERL